MTIFIVMFLSVLISLTVWIYYSKLFMKQQEKWLKYFFDEELEWIKRIFNS